MTGLILPTDEQVERACAAAAVPPGRDWSDDSDFFDQHERRVWRDQCRTMLTILLNKNKILGLDTLT